MALSTTVRVPAASSTRARSNAASRQRVIAIKATASVQPITPAVIEQRELGQTGLQVPVIGVGAWSWGDRSGYWGYGKEYSREASLEAYKALVEAGLTFIDTAEVYGFGLSETFLGEFIKEVPSTPAPLIATKYAPQPWRLSAASVPDACRASLKRLQLEQMG
ncbi:aldo/keto reductase [Monoraphidium neglectum]|uniref:Aldo/keto reductase n=1 Tax=Monoraphidium neglectum TaxID=145388 RepID=A0A0D2J470_9CHLO|nr:aldo/keto reductase [Monoraphidium neglectum]KIY94697.1 aldo/keto reductase [Monoraphidium neglectum]|eukprot:XP_013893717.1 aldo/keto reductase [Monoraphidium neglectum]